jgi:hypothetical protein
MNVFIDRIKDGKIRNLAQLKRCYRTLAKGIHPDTSAIDASGTLFARLQADFEEARRAILAMASVPPRSRDEDWKQLFQQLMSSGFPVDARVKATGAYRRRVEEFGRLVDGKGIGGMGSFAAVERDLLDLRGESSIPQPLFGSVRLIFYGIVSYCNYPTKFTRDAILRQYGDVSGELRKRGFLALDAFAGWMIGELG